MDPNRQAMKTFHTSRRFVSAFVRQRSLVIHHRSIQKTNCKTLDSKRLTGKEALESEKRAREHGQESLRECKEVLRDAHRTHCHF